MEYLKPFTLKILRQILCFFLLQAADTKNMFWLFYFATHAYSHSVLTYTNHELISIILNYMENPQKLSNKNQTNSWLYFGLKPLKYVLISHQIKATEGSLYPNVQLGLPNPADIRSCRSFNPWSCEDGPFVDLTLSRSLRK